ncbi:MULTISPECIES: NACHT domain-containing protein [unclassified Corallococcus]|uniref:NACHT domain-containing protein n=1 Tax=unclassified Corallococcus TaxID=2685029 RepID=UPI001A8EA9D8|nr:MULTISPECIES: NACHT domain-containing protein [unclassified Corallococcus]MBN9686409.1 NACHT domain-containing protein [Corallococcus sp. NCSPR001]WAS82164.1 NACHT domain-containing protein [Corallococcus sp. NCRR]
MLLPQYGLVGVAIEGFSADDEVSKDATEIADAVLYYGRQASFVQATRVVVVQVKYSKAAELKPFRVADAKKTIEKFANTYRAHLRKHGVTKTRAKLRFELVTNRPILAELEHAVQKLAAGTAPSGAAAAQAKQFQAAARLHGKELVEFARRIQFTGLTGDLQASKRDLAAALSDWTAARDSQARLWLNEIRQLARDKASLASEQRNVISRTDLLAAFEIGHEDDLLPCPTSFPDVGAVVAREQLADTATMIPALDRPLMIHADGGVGKTVFLCSLARQLESAHEVVLFDCFGMGQYRAPSDARHLPGRGLLHIVNRLACRGLCDPLLPGTYNDNDLIRTVRSRLTQAAETGARSTRDRQLILLLDAIDNAGEHASAQDETSFPLLLLRELATAGRIAGMQLVVSARSHRRAAATGGVDCSELELLPFSIEESREFLRPRVNRLTEARLLVAQSRSRGNGRILEHLAKEGADLLAQSEVNKVIHLDDLLRKKIQDALRDAEKQGYRDGTIHAFLGGLATLPPPVPIQEFAEANGLSEGAANSFASDLADLLEHTKHGIMFRDEPTETLIRETYGADKAALRALAKNLLAMQERSLYAATTLPDLLKQLGDGDQLFDLAFDPRMPTSIASAAGKQAIRQARLRAAVAFAATHDDSDRLVPLLVELSTLAAINQRGTTYLLDHPDLTVAMDDIHALRRMFEARTAWPGSRHARLAIAHVLAGDMADAHRHAQRLVEWRNHYFEQAEDPRFQQERPTAIDMAAIPLCLLARGDGKGAARELNGWRDWYAYEVAVQCFALTRAGAAKGLISPQAVRELLTPTLAKPSVLAAAVAYADGDEDLQRELISDLAARGETVDCGEAHHRPQERPILMGMLRAATVAAVRGLYAESSAIAASISLPTPALYTFMAQYSFGDVYPYVAIQVLKALAQSRAPEERDLLPAELAKISASLPPSLNGQPYRDALKQALQASVKKGTEADSAESLSYETKSSAERFLDGRLSSLLRIATAFTHAVKPSSSQAAGRLKPLIEVWCELRVQNDYYSGGTAAQRQHDAIGERLITLALAVNPDFAAEEITQFVETVSAPGVTTAGTLVEIAEILAARARHHVLAGQTAIKARQAIEREDDVVQRATLFAHLARAMGRASGSEASSYFLQGLEQMDAIGSGDWEFVSELMHFSRTLQGTGLPDADSHTLSNICDLNLGEAHKFDWASYGAALAKTSGVKGMARLTRWEDRDRISLEYTLLPYLKPLLDNHQIDPTIALTMLRVSNPVELWSCGTEQFVEALEARGASPAIVTELIEQYQHNNPSTFGSQAPRALAQWASRVLGEESAHAANLSAAAASIDATTHDYNELNNWRPSSPSVDPEEQEAVAEARAAVVAALAHNTNPLDELSLAYAIDALEGETGWGRPDVKLLELLRAKVLFADWPRYIELIARQPSLDLYAKAHELEACQEAWSAASAAVPKALAAAADWIVRENADDFVPSGYLSTWQLKRMTKLTGVDEHALTLALLHQYSRPGTDVPAAVWLSFAAAFNTNSAPGVGQAALTRLLASGAAKLAALVADGAWNERLYPPDDSLQVTAGLIWFALGSGHAERRWMAAHSLRTAVRLGRSDVLNAVVARFDERDAGAFGAPELPFYYLHAQLWLLIALARIAMEAPQAVAAHRAFLERTALDTADPHVLRQHFARAALLACQDTGQVQLPPVLRKSLVQVNRSPFALQVTQGYNGGSVYESRPADRPTPEPELHFEYDFDKSDVSQLSALFDRTLWDTHDAMTAWVRQHDRHITHMHELGGRSGHRREGRGAITDQHHTYGEQLCWHALHAVAGQFLPQHPVTRRRYDNGNPWHAWIRGRVLTRADGLWLADGTEWQPVVTRVTLRELAEDGVGMTADPAKLRSLLGIEANVGEWLVIDGNWHSVEGIEIEIQSALIPSAKADQAAVELAREAPFRAHLPYTLEEDNSSLSQHPFVPWIVHSHAEGGIDEADALGVLGAAQRARPSDDIIAFGALQPADEFGSRWIEASGVQVVRVEAWCQLPDHGEGRRMTGARMCCRSAFVRKVLTAQQADLILLIKLTRTDSGGASRLTRFWHTTAVVRVGADLSMTTYPGCANALHKARY